MITTPTKPTETAVLSVAYNPYQTKAELMRTFGRGERYTHGLIDDLEAYVAEHPETYRGVSVYSALTDSSRLYYNVFVVNHFIGHKGLLESGMEVAFDYNLAVEQFHKLVLLQSDMMNNDRLRQETKEDN